MPGSGATHSTGHAGGKSVAAVADSQGLTVSWGGVDLGRLTGVEIGSPELQFEDVTNLTASLVTYTNTDGSTSHKGVVRQLSQGDITPGTVSVEFIGSNALTWSMIGQAKTLTITHASGALALSAVAAVLKSFNRSASVGELATGSADFQLLGI